MPGRRKVHAPREHHSRRRLAADSRYSEREDAGPRHHDRRVPNSFEARDADLEGEHTTMGGEEEVVHGGACRKRQAGMQRTAGVSRRWKLPEGT